MTSVEQKELSRLRIRLREADQDRVPPIARQTVAVSGSTSGDGRTFARQ